MGTNNKGGVGWGIAIAVFSITFMQTGNMGANSGFQAMCAAFPQYSESVLQLALSLPTASGIIVALLAGKLVTWISKKKLSLIAAALFVIGGLTTFFFAENLPIVLTGRVLSGFSFALCATLATSVVVEYYRGDRRGKMMGYKQFVSCGAGMLFSYFGGVMVTFGWQYYNLIMLSGVICFFLILTQLPDNGPVKSETGEKAKLTISKTVIYYAFCIFMVTLVMNVFVHSMALRLINDGIADPTRVGIVFSLFSIGGLCAGLIFGRVLPILKRFTGPVFVFGSALNFWILATSNSLILILIGSFIHGVSFYMLCPHMTVIMCDSVPKPSHTLAIAIFGAALYLGQTLSPYVVIPASELFFDGSFASRFLFTAIVSTVYAFYAVIKAFIRKNQASGIPKE